MDCVDTLTRIYTIATLPCLLTNYRLHLIFLGGKLISATYACRHVATAQGALSAYEENVCKDDGPKQQLDPSSGGGDHGKDASQQIGAPTPQTKHRSSCVTPKDITPGKSVRAMAMLLSHNQPGTKETPSPSNRLRTRVAIQLKASPSTAGLTSPNLTPAKRKHQHSSAIINTPGKTPRALSMLDSFNQPGSKDSPSPSTRLRTRPTVMANANMAHVTPSNLRQSSKSAAGKLHSPAQPHHRAAPNSPARPQRTAYVPVENVVKESGGKVCDIHTISEALKATEATNDTAAIQQAKRAGMVFFAMQIV